MNGTKDLMKETFTQVFKTKFKMEFVEMSRLMCLEFFYCDEVYATE